MKNTLTVILAMFVFVCAHAGSGYTKDKDSYNSSIRMVRDAHYTHPQMYNVYCTEKQRFVSTTCVRKGEDTWQCNCYFIQGKKEPICHSPIYTSTDKKRCKNVAKEYCQSLKSGTM